MNVGTKLKKKITYISAELRKSDQDEMVKLLKEFRDYFAWDYDELLGLERSLVEHKLSIKSGCRSVKQQPQRMTPEVTIKVKEEIERLLKAGFIRIAR